jgi:hypothetical protein
MTSSVVFSSKTPTKMIVGEHNAQLVSGDEISYYIWGNTELF